METRGDKQAEPRTDAPYWLLLEDDAFVSGALSRLLGEYAAVRHAKTVSEALQLLASTSGCCGAVLDINLPDGSGLEVLQEMRRRTMTVPTLVLTAYCEHENISRAQMLGAQFLWKPWNTDNVLAFAKQALNKRGFHSDFHDRLQKFSKSNQLSPRESELLGHTTAGHSLKDMPAQMGISANSVKTLVRRILGKTGASSMQEIVRKLHQQMLGTPASSENDPA